MKLDCICSNARRLLTLLGAAIPTLFFTPIAVAQEDDAPTVMRVEGDWELLIGTPDPDNDGPQIINVISPTADITGQHAVLELNHQTFPAFYGGGLQLQMWTGDILNQFSNSKSVALLNKPSESITYTMSMRVEEGSLYVQVLNGKGTTWVDFGVDGRLTGKRTSAVASLNAYTHTLSAKKSRVSYAGNRVRKMLLKEVRTYGADGELIQSQEVNLIVHQTESVDQ